MIEPKELRIGNWVESRFGETRVTAVSIIHDEISVYDPDRPNDTNQSHDLPFNKIEPIQLTEEWLLRFGFVKLDKYSFVKDGFFIHKRKIGFIFNVGRKKVKQSFVHTIQNTYFCIEQKELLCKDLGVVST